MATEDQHDLDDVYQLKQVVAALKLLSGSTRLEILASLGQSPKDVSEVAEALKFAIPAVSRQLRALKIHHVVDVKHIKQHHVYQLNSAITVKVLPGVLEFHLCEVQGCEIVIRVPRRISA